MKPFEETHQSLKNKHFNPYSSLPHEKPINAYFEHDVQRFTLHSWPYPPFSEDAVDRWNCDKCGAVFEVKS